MKYNISKELFEAVTGLNYSYCNNEGIVYLNDNGSKVQTPILYNDFFFKCKEWAFEQEYLILSGNNNFMYTCDIARRMTDDDWKCFQRVDSEQQAVFDACEYIIKGLMEESVL